MMIREALNQAAQELERQGMPSARLDAEILLSHFLETDRAGLYRTPERLLRSDQLGGFRQWITRRRQGEPVAYILNRKEFWALLLEVNDKVLVPRPDTEALVEEVLACCSSREDQGLRILEIGTGSGAIAVALATELKSAWIVATDISGDALSVAARNADRHGVQGKIAFVLGDTFAPLSGSFDIILSNPPYIPDSEFGRLPREIRQYEPPVALIGGREGTDLHRRLIEQGASHLRKGGFLVMEIGAGQRPCIEGMLRSSPDYEAVGFRKDYGGLDRVVRARRKG
jgi:release factor glutamine methyltransferase